MQEGRECFLCYGKSGKSYLKGLRGGLTAVEALPMQLNL